MKQKKVVHDIKFVDYDLAEIIREFKKGFEFKKGIELISSKHFIDVFKGKVVFEMFIETTIDVEGEVDEDNQSILDQVKDSKIKKALILIQKYRGTDGAHHKDWVIDQVTRSLLEGDYGDFVREYMSGEDGPNTYEWEEGIAP